MLPSHLELIYFYEVANHSSFTRAARKLNLSQPSLSLAIKRLEDSLQNILFVRHSQGVTLTRAGKILFKDVKELLEKWSVTKNNVQTAHESIKGRVNISCNSMLVFFINELLANLIDDQHALEINIIHERTQKIMKDIVEGTIDIGIVVDPDLHPDVILIKIVDIEFGFWAATHAIINFETEKLTIICDPSLSTSQYLIKKLQDKQQKCFRLLTTNRLEVVTAMTMANGGIGILPTSLVARMFADKLQRVVQTPTQTKTMYLACNYQNRDVAAVRYVWQALKDFGKNKLFLPRN